MKWYTYNMTNNNVQEKFHKVVNHHNLNKKLKKKKEAENGTRKRCAAGDLTA